jgi:hypothetical protein
LSAAVATVAAMAAPPQTVTLAVSEAFDQPSREFTSDGSVVWACGTTANDAHSADRVRVECISRNR